LLLNIMALSSEALPTAGTASVPANDRVVVRASFGLLLALIFLQRFALPAGGVPVSLSLLSVFVWATTLLVTNRLRLSRARLLAFLAFATLATASQLALAGLSGLSFMQLLATYALFCVQLPIPRPQFLTIMRGFQTLMLVPAILTFVQLAWPVLLHGSQLTLDSLVPPSLLLPHYAAAQEFGFGSHFVRPTGLFFLEASHLSAFLGSAIIIEIAYFRRTLWIVGFTMALLVSLGGTGAVMLVVAAPFFARRPTIRVLVTIGLVVALLVALLLAPALPFLNRLGELFHSGSSAFERLIQPAAYLLQLIADGQHLLGGTGAGSITDRAGSPWPITKLTAEYGLATALCFLGLYAVSVRHYPNLPLTVGLTVIFMCTGGYLLSPVLPGLIIALLTSLRPLGEADLTRFAPGSPPGDGSHFAESRSRVPG
jgi:hypothetical protein